MLKKIKNVLISVLVLCNLWSNAGAMSVVDVTESNEYSRNYVSAEKLNNDKWNVLVLCSVNPRYIIEEKKEVSEKSMSSICSYFDYLNSGITLEELDNGSVISKYDNIYCNTSIMYWDNKYYTLSKLCGFNVEFDIEYDLRIHRNIEAVAGYYSYSNVWNDTDYYTDVCVKNIENMTKEIINDDMRNKLRAEINDMLWYMRNVNTMRVFLISENGIVGLDEV